MNAVLFPSVSHDNKIVIDLECLGNQAYPVSATVVTGREPLSLGWLADIWPTETWYCWFRIDDRRAEVRTLWRTS